MLSLAIELGAVASSGSGTSIEKGVKTQYESGLAGGYL